MIIRKKTVTISSKIVLSAVLSALILTPEASAIGSVILDDSDQSNSVSIVAPADVTTNYSLTFPAALGTNGQIMTIDGSGTISFSDKISDDEVTTAKILDGNVTFAKLDAAGVVDATDTIATNDNDTTIPTTAAVIDYVDANGGPFEAGSTGTGSITSSVNKTNGGDATGNYSTASGYLSRASGDYSVAIGESPIASGASSVAMGGGVSATGNYSVAIGDVSSASGAYSVAIGYIATALGYHSIAIGAGTVAESGFETVIGAYDTDYTPTTTDNTWTTTDRLFVIGNGQDGALSDALVMLKSGDTTANGTWDFTDGLTVSGGTIDLSGATVTGDNDTLYTAGTGIDITSEVVSVTGLTLAELDAAAYETTTVDSLTDGDDLVTEAGVEAYVAANSASNTLTDTQIFVGNGSNVATGVAVSGDATISNTGVVTIAADAVTTAEIAADTIVAGDVATDAITADELADAAVDFAAVDGAVILTAAEDTLSDFAAASETTIPTTSAVAAYVASELGGLTDNDTTYTAGTGIDITSEVVSVTGLTLAELDAAAYETTTVDSLTDGDDLVTEAGVEAYVAANSASNTLTDTQIFVGNGSNVATGVAVSGDATISNTGVVTIAADAVTTAEIAADTIVAGDVATDAITADELADAAVDFAAVDGAVILTAAEDTLSDFAAASETTIPTTSAVAAYVAANGDDLGNHTATTDVILGATFGITDTDGNTQIQVEEAANDDTVRIDVAGTEVFNLDGTRLDITGNIVASGTITSSSDRNLKKKINPLKGALQKLMKITGVNYEWKDGREAGNQVGVIAQDVQAVYPELVSSNEDGLTVNYGGLVAPLIEATREQQAEIETLKAENAQLKIMNQVFETRLSALEAAGE